MPIAGAQGCNATNSPGQSGGMTANTVTNLPDVSSNEPPIVTVSPYTNTLPAVNPVNEGMIWPGNPQIPAHDEVIEAAGQQLNNTIWTAGAQSHSDDSAIVNAINTAGAQAHNDAGAVKGAIDTARQQNHSDLSQVLGAVVNLTNGIPKNPAMTNYATESTLESFQSLYGTNSAGLNGSVSNATAALTGLATSFSNLTDITNLDIASEGTLQGVTNLLTAINTNLLAVGTNLWSAFTNLAQQVTLVGISNLFGGNYSNSIVTDDLGVSNAFNTVFTLFDTNISTTNFSVTVSNEASYEQAAADSAAASPDLQGAETGLAGFLAQMSPVTVDDSWGEPDMTFDFGPFLSPAVGKIMSKGIADGSTVMDLNPMHNADLAAVFNAAKSLFAWLIAIIYLLKCARDAGKAIEMCELARGVVVTGPTTKKTYS